ncbi:response regulator transcription factor [Cohnella cholangitidis]|uniref:response regulator transcription factor n=1 Tax=Cohnella cholangitidis TaxID=2598458 RepID=UPI0015FB8520|nr:response regulator [Cohnella cholangitidis]
MRALLTEILKDSFCSKTDIEIRAFRDGEAFFADSWHLERAHFILVLDGVLPGMDGLEVLERLRSTSESDQYSVIMLTGRSSEEDIVRALQLGADDYLTKPFHIEELQARIVRLIQRIQVYK